MPRAKTNKSTPTKARVIFSDNSPSTTTTNNSSNTETTPSSNVDAAEDLRFTDTQNKVLQYEVASNPHWKRRNCVLRDPDRLRDQSIHLLLLAGS